MKLTHHYFTLAGPSAIKHVCKPVVAVNYINMRLDDYAFYTKIETTPLKAFGEIRSKITISDNDYIILQGHSMEILPILAWLSEARTAYSDFLDSQK